MLQIRLICVGRLKEKYLIDASNEFIKRLCAYCKIETEEVQESRLSQRPSQAEIDAALKSEAAAVTAKLLKGSAVIALCIEGQQPNSNELAQKLDAFATGGVSRLSVVIGGSYGLHADFKAHADLRLSMSRLTFPHHLARIMLLEQLYRSFKILEGGKYHK